MDRVTWRNAMVARFKEGALNLVYQTVLHDETWIYWYDPKSKQQSTVRVYRGEPKPTKLACERSASKQIIAPFLIKLDMWLLLLWRIVVPQITIMTMPSGPLLRAEYDQTQLSMDERIANYFSDAMAEIPTATLVRAARARPGGGNAKLGSAIWRDSRTTGGRLSSVA
ncbi:hypothetical protein EVAR_43569_1 [Eumeta japonica]|uniref:Mariner Mos1 transposase n=1 Tax=Eumeta variegata TaxID=151549 RepID=A0A4C1XF76_EUMVA|nr:hypothetical protein EVAR_43569_1 [Eumeta japonica]